MTNISIYSPVWAALCLEYAAVDLTPEIIFSRRSLILR